MPGPGPVVPSAVARVCSVWCVFGQGAVAALGVEGVETLLLFGVADDAPLGDRGGVGVFCSASNWICAAAAKGRKEMRSEQTKH